MTLWYNLLMATQLSLDRLIHPVGECLTLETAVRLANLKADSELQSRVDELAEKANQGTLTSAERSEYEQFVSFSEFVTLLKLRARDVLDHAANNRWMQRLVVMFVNELGIVVNTAACQSS
ncbi:MAG: hypothetical protein CMJ78_21375 [Planctomycetaceae bacterium]|nr:hypothetical protein [Planctomycetaceae bacterium]